MKNHRPALLAFSGFSGSGKTTLIEKLIGRFTADGFSVAAIKHDAHEFEIDKEGKDSWRFARAGASAVLLVSQKKMALMQAYNAHNSPLPLARMVKKFFSAYNIVLVEGYRMQKIPRVLVSRDGKIPTDIDPRLIIAIVHNDFDSSLTPLAHEENKNILRNLQKPMFSAASDEQLYNFILDFFMLVQKK